MSLDSIGTVPDLTDRVVRVSFAPAGGETTSSSGDNLGNNTAAAAGAVPEHSNKEPDQVSLGKDIIDDYETTTNYDDITGNVSNPPAYDTLSTHSRVSASDPPPEYQTVTELS